MQKRRSASIYQVLTHAGSLVPLALLVYAYFTHGLTVNPIQAATLRTGKTALALLAISLACTPAASILDFKPALKMRRPLGLYAFMYAAIHFLIFVWWDYGLNWDFLVDGFLQKPYALVGFTAFLLLLPLAITSTRGWQRRLGTAWKKLHKLVYFAAGLVVLHYVWVVKSDYREPLLWGLGFSLLMVLRIPAIRDRLRSLRRGLRRKSGRRKSAAARSESSSIP